MRFPWAAAGRLAASCLVAGLSILLAAAPAAQLAGPSGDAARSPQPPASTAEVLPATIRLVPADLADTAWLEARRTAQMKAASDTTVFRGFQFHDRRSESGITFRHRVVEDAARAYKAAHYDHGTAVAVADIDGDSLLDVYFVNQAGGNQLWRNTGHGRFVDVTLSAGVALADRVGVAAAFGDVDNDGDADLFVTSVRGGNVLFENDGRGLFRDIAATAGVDYVGHSSAAVFFDYNRDGRLDLFVANVGRYTTNAVGGAFPYYLGLADAFSGHLMPARAERSILYRNDGGNRFTDVSTETGLVDLSWSGDATPVDVNEDGWLDLYVLNMQGSDEYYENQGGTRFVHRSREVFPRTSWGAMGVKVFDANNDGQLDLFITDMHSDMSATVDPHHEHMRSQMQWPETFRGDGRESLWGNSLFLREGPSRFTEVSEAFNGENYWPWGPSVGDLNADGFDDVFIAAAMNYPFRYGTNSVKLNDGGHRFVDAEFLLGIEPRSGGLTTPWFELDASGRDRAHADAAGLTGRVTVVGARGTRSAAVFDVDADGDLDIVTNEFGTEPMVLISDLAARREVRYLQVRLVGTRSNRDGLGAVVTVAAGGATFTKVMDGASGYLAHSLIPLYFGLGEADEVTAIEVHWPSGTRQTVHAPGEINRLIQVQEP